MRFERQIFLAEIDQFYSIKVIFSIILVSNIDSNSQYIPSDLNSSKQSTLKINLFECSFFKLLF